MAPPRAALGTAREVRPDQLLMVATQPSTVDPTPVRATTADDLNGLFPPAWRCSPKRSASPDRRRDGAGLPPPGVGSDPPRSFFAAFDDDGLFFKAELGALSRRAGQIQGLGAA